MEISTLLKDILQPLAIFFGGGFALYQYGKQQKFKRLQNLSSLWKNFSADQELIALFSTMNDIELGKHELQAQLSNTSPAVKLKYLVLLEEVSLYLEEFEVDRSYAAYLFQWHFYFAYQSNLTKTLFWDNLGGEEEMNASYWQKSRNQSKLCKPN